MIFLEINVVLKGKRWECRHGHVNPCLWSGHFNLNIWYQVKNGIFWERLTSCHSNFLGHPCMCACMHTCMLVLLLHIEKTLALCCGSLGAMVGVCWGSWNRMWRCVGSPDVLIAKLLLPPSLNCALKIKTKVLHQAPHELVLASPSTLSPNSLHYVIQFLLWPCPSQPQPPRRFSSLCLLVGYSHQTCRSLPEQ